MIRHARITMHCDGPGCAVIFQATLGRLDDDATQTTRDLAARAGWARFRWRPDDPMGDYCPTCIKRRNQ